ncbi:MAG TPA: hypothetical protein VG013_12460 [Gemmataceae bacterium]|jgi:predicted transposase YdaD|nr:hypothetical protein [Gemmataceae bacterium]
MAKPFDITVKDLVEERPAECIRFFQLGPAGQVTMMDADLSTITAEADKVIRVGGPPPWLVHLEFQASYDAQLGPRLLRYNVLLAVRHGLPVQSAVVLLRPEADGPAITGRVEYEVPGSGRYLGFDYKVIRAWEKPIESVMVGGVGTLPFAPLSDVSRAELPGIIRRMEERLSREVTRQEAAKLWTATYVLMGLRYPPEFATQLLQGVRGMKESATYQAIVAEGVAQGMVQGMRKALLVQGRKRFGPADPTTEAAIQAISDASRLEQLEERVMDVSSWQELLGQPPSRPRNGRRKKKP